MHEPPLEQNLPFLRAERYPELQGTVWLCCEVPRGQRDISPTPRALLLHTRLPHAQAVIFSYSRQLSVFGLHSTTGAHTFPVCCAASKYAKSLPEGVTGYPKTVLNLQ